MTKLTPEEKKSDGTRVKFGLLVVYGEIWAERVSIVHGRTHPLIPPPY
jgi:hypothetical protein